MCVCAFCSDECGACILHMYSGEEGVQYGTVRYNTCAHSNRYINYLALTKIPFVNIEECVYLYQKTRFLWHIIKSRSW
jgi:hypothetical protein